MKRKSILLTAISIAVLFLSVFVSCNQEEIISSDNLDIQPSEYSHLYDVGYVENGTGDLSVQDLTRIHNNIASIYQVRSELQSDWTNRYKYTLDAELFVNEYIYNYMKMYLYESVRYLSIDGTYIRSLEIDKDNIKKIDDLYLIPIVVIDVLPGTDEDDVYEQFFVLEKEENGLFVFVNFITGYLFDKESEVYTKVKIFDENDWNRSIYSINEEGLLKSNISTGVYEYIKFIQSDISKDEYIKNNMKNNINKSSLSSYDRQSVVNYATTYTSTNAGVSSYNFNYRYFSVDCANFVSQCLKAGGFKNDYGSYGSCNAWYYNDQGTSSTGDDNNSITWSTANGLKRYLYDCGGYTTVVYPDDLWSGQNIEIGDPFFFDKTPPVDEAPYYNHSMIVTQIVDGWDVRYSAHTTNRKNRTIHHSTTPYSFWFTDRWTRGFHIVSLNGLV